MDSNNLRDVFDKYGDGRLRNYPTIAPWRYFVWYPMVRRMTPARPLNYIPYSKEIATDTLVRDIGWRPYARKHGESLFTKFFQNYYLPEKFGIDKRRAHLSSRIVAGSLTRDDALDLLEEPLYDEQELERDRDYLCRKLRVSREEFAELMAAPPHNHTDFKTWDRFYNVLTTARESYRRVSGKQLRIYTK